MRRADPRVRAERARGTGAAGAIGRLEPGPAIERLFGTAERLGPPSRPAVIVHGDLHLRHLLVGEGGDASGVIDWGDSCLADPAVDLSLAYCGFATRPARRCWRHTAGRRGTRTAGAVCGVLCVSLAEYAISGWPGNPLLRETLAALERVVSG